MAAYTLPVPRLARPLQPIDPFRRRQAYLRLLSMLFHAEAAALDGFKLLTDPRFVEHHPLFEKAAAKLVADEAKHLEDIEEIIDYLDAGPLMPPSDTEREFWTAWRSGDLFALPFKPAVASLFCLLSEGLGYAVLYHLAESTTDPWIKERLLANVHDEKSHLRLSITVLSRTLEADPKGFTADAAFYLAGYALVAKNAIQEIRALLDDVGLDFDIVMGSSLRFVGELLEIVLGRKAEGVPTMWKAFFSAGKIAQEHPIVTDLVFASTFIEYPKVLSRVVYRWGQWNLWKRGIPVTSAIAIASMAEAEREPEEPMTVHDLNPPRTTIVPPAAQSGVHLTEGLEADESEEDSSFDEIWTAAS